jgi:uncharacterized protein DUF4136
MQRTKTILTCALLFLTVSFAFGQKVRFDYDHSANFSKYKTFTWIKEPVTEQDPFMKQRIVNAVNMQLVAKGLKLVQGNADLGVAVNVATQQKQTLNTFYDGFDGWGWGFDGPVTTTVETYTEGTIVADLFDTQTKKIVWRGTATKEVSSKPSKVTEEIEKSIEKMFRHFPPYAA